MEKSKLKKHNKLLIILGIVMVVCIFLVGLLITFDSGFFAKVDVNTDISKYQNYIGENADEKYKNKWDMDESIFPKVITDNMNVEDYKMVYYNPWDAQYLSYLVVKYDAETYKGEVERLEAYPSNKYLGYYGADGFDSKYELLAMNADSYQGFVYALTDKKDTIVYVEIIFCNYFMDLEYKKYINGDFLPMGFDATSNNPYEQKMRDKES